MDRRPEDMPGAGAFAHLSSRKDFLKMAGAADYGTHGKFYVMDGPTWENYYEFPP